MCSKFIDIYEIVNNQECWKLCLIGRDVVKKEVQWVENGEGVRKKKSYFAEE